MDIEYDMMRSARDARFLYIRNFSPELPYAGLIPYRNQSAIMQEWLRLQAEGTLTGAPSLWMRTSRPAEELYDVRADPHQINDIAANPAHGATLARMRTAVTEWMARIGDQGLINEPELIQRMWPGGVQPETAPPYIVPRRATDAPSRAATHRDLAAPLEVVIYVPTQGASIGYTTEDGPSATWRLYTGPIRVDEPTTLRAKAIRYGYKESAETRIVITSSTDLPTPVPANRPMRWPRPTVSIALIARTPVSSGVRTGSRSIALIGRRASGSLCTCASGPLRSIGWPCESTTRPSRPSPTGRCSVRSSVRRHGWRGGAELHRHHRRRPRHDAGAAGQAVDVAGRHQVGAVAGEADDLGEHRRLAGACGPRRPSRPARGCRRPRARGR